MKKQKVLLKPRSKKKLAEYQRRVDAVNTAHMVYRAALRTLVGWGAFQNIDADATHKDISLHLAAKRWVDGFWNE